MITLLTILGGLAALFATLSIWNGALSATGLANIPPGRGERYHSFAQRVWLFLSVLYTVAVYVIVFATGLA